MLNLYKLKKAFKSENLIRICLSYQIFMKDNILIYKIKKIIE